MFSDFFYLGKVTKHFGLIGEVSVFIDSDEPQKYYNMESVFFDIEGELIPFFIENIKIKSNNQLIIKFSDVDENNVNQLIGLEMYQPKTMLPELTGNKFYYHEVLHFEVIDEQRGKLGEINEILEYPAQAVFSILHPKGEILIPIVDEYIKKVDRENRIIEINAPSDLIDIYIGE